MELDEPCCVGTSLTKEQWIDVLTDEKVTNHKNISILKELYVCEEHKSSAGKIAPILGYETHAPLNGIIGSWGRRVVKKIPYRLTKRSDGSERKWDLFFDGKDNGKDFSWKIKTELIEALEELNLVDEQLYCEEIPKNIRETLFEGAKKKIIVNSYERNNKARRLCIKHYGVKCQVCNFDFEKTYGEIGKKFIHIHHLVRISDIKEEYMIDPIEDLRPVCPNCHAMLHKKEPPFTIEELKGMLNID